MTAYFRQNVIYKTEKIQTKVTATLRKGKKVTWWTDEAFQRWITSDGREVIVSRKKKLVMPLCGFLGLVQ